MSKKEISAASTDEKIKARGSVNAELRQYRQKRFRAKKIVEKPPESYSDDVRLTVPLFDAERTMDILEKEKGDSRKAHLLDLMEKGPDKPLAMVTDEAILRLEQLGQLYPNFDEVIELIEESLYLHSTEDDAVINFPNILLVGEPGVGKTRFLSELGKLMETGFYSTDLSAMSAGFVLSGNSSSWSDGKPGFISNSLRDSDVANPIILIDEIDKASADARYDPMGVFHSVLEPHTASRFIDEFLEIPLDCSYINFVASANYEEQIPEPIITRMIVITIEAPTFQQVGVIAQNIYKELRENNRWGRKFNPELTPEIRQSMSSLAPREIRKVLQKACGKSVRRMGRESDYFSLSLADIDVKKPVTRRSVGFL